MRIADIIKNKLTFSFEIFPPKNDQPLEPLTRVIGKLKTFSPDFISCTYGAGGTNRGRSLEICETIKKMDVECLTNMTCIGNTKADLKHYIDEYIAVGVENIMALRGDFPQGAEQTNGDFAHADSLIAFIKSEFPQLGVSCACYPEIHIQCPTPEQDIAHLKIKQNNGAEFAISQLCYDVDEFSRWLAKVRKAGVTMPIVAGIMPVISPNGVKRMTLFNGCSIPKELARILGKYGENEEDFKKAGKEYTVELLYRYINAGFNGMHIFTLNKYDDVADIITMSGIRTQDLSMDNASVVLKE
ncbi:MAG: methylenetetrahydrofolate reductase [Lachnospiraceae bacterium]|nr:methylenetetrahydrofolate reductase [Lachnospiraceae bacterium]